MKFEFERRRYDRTTYTWAFVVCSDGHWLSLGDPWPSLTWPKKELERAAEFALEPRPFTRERYAEVYG